MQMIETTLEKIFDVEEMKCVIESTSIGLHKSTIEPTAVHLCIFVIELEVKGRTLLYSCIFD